MRGAFQIVILLCTWVVFVPLIAHRFEIVQHVSFLSLTSYSEIMMRNKDMVHKQVPVSLATTTLYRYQHKMYANPNEKPGIPFSIMCQADTTYKHCMRHKTALCAMVLCFFFAVLSCKYAKRDPVSKRFSRTLATFAWLGASSALYHYFSIWKFYTSIQIPMQLGPAFYSTAVVWLLLPATQI